MPLPDASADNWFKYHYIDDERRKKGDLVLFVFVFVFRVRSSCLQCFASCDNMRVLVLNDTMRTEVVASWFEMTVYTLH